MKHGCPMPPARFAAALFCFAMSGRGFACQPVSGARIRGLDLAAANPSFSALAAELDLGPSPAPGNVRFFRRPELERIAGHHAIELLAAPEETCFERTAQALEPEKLIEAMRSAAVGEPQIELLDFSRNKVPQGRIEFAREGLSASGLWRGRVVDSDGRSTPIWARVKLAGRATGSALSPVAPHEVERGDSVRVEVSAGNVMLGFDGSAETAGRAGDFILVKNPSTGRRLRARVESKGKVRISR
jgi:hypothetical protein